MAPAFSATPENFVCVEFGATVTRLREENSCRTVPIRTGTGTRHLDLEKER